MSPLISVRELAARAEIDLDEALVALWEIGIESVIDPDDRVPSRRIGAARRALGLPASNEETRVQYWLNRSRLNAEEFAAKLAELGIFLSPSARKMPKNSIRKLRRAFDIESTRAVVESKESRTVRPLHWEDVGTASASGYLEEAEVLAIHTTLEDEFRSSEDPILPEGVRDLGLLRSALSRPHTSLGDIKKYPTVEMAGAALVHSLVHNHAFQNGNKRTAFVSLLAFLDANDTVLTCSEDELFRFMLRVGQHSLVPMWADQLPDREVMEISRWIRTNSRRVEREERMLRWHRLKQRLSSFNCHWAPAPGVGSRINIWREVERRGRFRSKRERLHAQVVWRGDATEADRGVIHEIRRRLELDDGHDIDSATFYAGAKIDAFILQHRRILERLAKF
jgi:death-on-curing family protein